MKNKVIYLVSFWALFTGCHRDWSLVSEIPTEFGPFEKTLLQTTHTFSIELFREVCSKEEKGKNVLISPLSVSMALGMAWNGASDETESAIRKTLGFGEWTENEINLAYQNIMKILPNLDPKTTLFIANSIWYREGFPVLPSFLQVAKTFFYAEARSLDFNSPQAPEIINQWVEAQTRGKIKEIVTAIDPLTMLFLINAVYFKALWQWPFNPELTHQDVFISFQGDSLPCDMMEQVKEFPYFETETFQAIDLPYGNGAFSMSIFLPKTGYSINEFIETWTEGQWNEWVTKFHSTKIMLQMPKFKVEYTKVLNAELAFLGMGIAFDPQRADFTRIVRREALSGQNLFIQQVLHKTFMEVDEKGTEAAGVTSISIGIVSIPPLMRIDRPFVYVIRETTSNIPLFMAKMERI